MHLLLISVWLGFIVVLPLPTFLVTVLVLVASPNLVKKFFSSGTKKPNPPEENTNIKYECHTYREMQERACRGMFKPNFEQDPNWQKNRDEIDAIRKRNKRINDAELAAEKAERDNKTAQTSI